MAVNFDNDITSRIERLRKQQMAASMGKTVEQMDQDREYFNEIKEIEIQDKMAYDEDYVPDPIPFTEEHQAGMDKQEAERKRKEALQNRYLPGAGQSPQYMGEAPTEVRKPMGIPAQMDPFVKEEMERRALQEEVAPQFSRYETPEQGEVTEPGIMERGMSALKEKFPTLRSQEEVEARLQEKAELQGTGLTDAWQSDPNIQEEIAARKIEQGKQAARDDFLEEEAPPWEENPVNPAVADIQRDENDPAVKEMKEVQDKPEDRKKIFEGKSKEETAMLKEELGNYYIGPGGYAINLNKMDASRERAVNMSMLQFVPDHAKSQMLASWGYIDQEDVDASPDDPTVQVAKINAEMEIAKQNSKNETDITKIDKTVEGTLNVTKVQVKAQKEQYTAANTLKRELALSDDEFRKLDLEDKNWRFMEKQELEAYMHNNGIDLDEKKLAALQDYQYAQINLGHSKILSVERVEKNMLKFKGKQWSDQYKLAGDQERRAMLLLEHTKGMDMINMATGNGQLDFAAVIAQQMGLPFIPDYKAYATAHARASNTDPNVKAVLDKHFPDMKASVVAGQYATYKNGRMKFYGGAPKEAGMPSNLDNWISADPTRGKTWDDMTAPEKEEYNSKEHWRAKKIIEATNSDLRNSTYNQYHTAVTNRTIDINPSGKDKGGTTTTTNANANKETIIDESPLPKIAKSGRDISKTAGRVLPTVIEEELKKQNPTPEKMKNSLKKGGNKFDSILEYETSPSGPANKRFKTKDDLLDFFEKRPKLLKEPVGIGGKTIGSGFSWMGDRSKQLDLNLQHYVIKELAKRKEQRRKNKKIRKR